MPHRYHSSLLQMTHFRFSQLFIPNPPIPNLNCIIPISSISLNLGHNISFSKTNHSNWNHLPIRLKVAHHSKFSSHNTNPSFHAHCHNGKAEVPVPVDG
ncbi:hypothetical protein OIU76_016427 [Salix suchowensis]|nr:hypothetical protein OIU76_016427 [Salix suchowensis]